MIHSRNGKRSWDREGEAMSQLKYGIAEGCGREIQEELQSMACKFDQAPCGTNWYAVWTRSRQEKVAASLLDALGVHHFLPMKSEWRQWSDRKQLVTTPLFAGYLFVRMNLAIDNRLQVLKIPGIAGFVGNSTGPSPIPDHQIESIHTVLKSKVECSVLPLFKEGERVRVVRGVLTGIEGKLVRISSAIRLVISVELIQKSLTVNVSPRDVLALDRHVA